MQTSPRGFAALLARMPQRFMAQALAVEQQKRKDSEAESKRLELEFLFGVEFKESGIDEWHDTVAAFNAR
ncbi:MAG TPA: hypothetical protein VGE36_17975 [Roseateles sp.]